MHWWLPALIAAMLAIPVVFWSNFSKQIGTGRGFFLSSLKAIAIGLLVLCLLEPMSQFEQAKPGANSLIVMADASQSLDVKDSGRSDSRAKELSRLLDQDATWLNQLERNFELRRYTFDERSTNVVDFQDYAANGRASEILNSMSTVGRRVAGKPTAGIILLTDGNESTDPDLADFDWSQLPPVYPVVIGDSQPLRDLSITNVTTSQTNFESAPVTIKVELVAQKFSGKTVTVQLAGEDDIVIESQEVRRLEDGKSFAVRFKLKPENRGVNVFEVRAFEKGTSADDENGEATLVNNRRLVIVDRGKGPFRVLYIAGRPNWEYKFMRRALADDSELDLVGLLRVANKEPKFTFRSRDGETTNPLFRGFGNQEDDTAEQYDEAVMIRLDTRDEVELRDGFPKDAAGMFEYDAIIIDDLEASFFTQDQKTLLSQFVSLRGGGLMMLGGVATFARGGYDRTPIGESLPVYLDQRSPTPENIDYRLDLTREGWVQPWIRIEPTREDELKRLETMPPFQTLSRSRSIKPGATILASATGSDDETHPALVVQRFGNGRTAAMLIGDLWRWKLQSENENEDLNKAWRQTLRWLVSETPRRVEVLAEPDLSQSQLTRIRVDIRDEEFKPQLNAELELKVITPSQKEIAIASQQDSRKVGSYVAEFSSREPGAYRVVASAKSPEGELIEMRETGWVSDPAVAEFESLQPNRDFLRQIANETGGELVEVADLESFASDFDARKVPVSETKSVPWWHRWSIFAAAIGLLLAEWGARRMWGLA
ncbi:hypothetical protein MFFC18_35000 [Mariniblastus fucicola]|uniref:Putative glutamine amidotransferase domain-containing protein n=2 Tax=Mariniblastus fucicola TaxID=980251 RepID=A0A5B9PDN3_9BACT|nr:hypothetical protein MFFC18_35000 [Mariniblastus fucicola]